MEQLGIISGTNRNSTYVNQDRIGDEIIQTHATTLDSVFDIELQQKEKNLPQINWILKLHKTPCKARFIAGSSSYTTTRLSKLISECLKLVRSHCTANCETIREWTGVNWMWIINNSLGVIPALEEKQLSLNHVSTWDFSTLFTSLPHAQLKKQFHALLERVFNTKGKSFIATNNFRTFWSTDRTSTRYTYFSCRELTLLSTTSTFALEALFSGRLLVYQWAPNSASFFGGSLPSYLRIRFHGQNNDTQYYKSHPVQQHLLVHRRFYSVLTMHVDLHQRNLPVWNGT